MSDALILLTTDFSPEAERAYPKAADFAQILGARILLATVVETSMTVPHGAPLAPRQSPPDTADLIDDAEKRIAGEAAKIAGAKVETAVLADDSVAHALIQLAKARHCAMIILSTHGRTGLRRLVLGSVAEQIVRRSPVPVLCVPAS